jgi:hypothetical protein
MKIKLVFIIDISSKDDPLRFYREYSCVPRTGEKVFFDEGDAEVEATIQDVHHLIEEDEVLVHLEVADEILDQLVRQARLN